MLPAFFILLLFAYSLVSRRLERTPCTAPILFTVAGVLVSPLTASPKESLDVGGLLLLAEVGLVLLLFTDASRTNLRLLGSIRNLPARLLSIGMLLTIALGAVVAKLIFPQFSWWEAGILAAILAPTDAGLGQIIVTSPKVPERIREALNVEAGLNDGLSVPFLLFFMAMAVSGGSEASFLRFFGEQLGLGMLIGAGVGLAGGWLLGVACRAAWMADSFRQIAVVTLPAVCLLLAHHVGASPFIAAFVAGLTVQSGFKDAGRHSGDFAEEWGQIFNLAVFLLFGVLVGGATGLFGIAPFLYALLSLTVIRMLPVAVALAGTGLDRRTVLFMGWFGPRGLASIVLGLVYLDQAARLPGEQATRLAVMATVLVSILAHGLTAQRGIRLLGRDRDPAHGT